MDFTQHDPSPCPVSAPFADGPAIEGDDDVLLSLGADVELNLASVVVRFDAEELDGAVRERFEPDGLPDASGVRVMPRAVQLGRALFPPRKARIVERILGSDHDFVVMLTNDPSDVGRERRMSALMPGHELTVDPDHGPIVDGAEVHHHPVGCRRIESSPVPDDVSRLPIPDPGQLRFRRVGHDDLTVEPPLVTHAELPLAVQVHPVAPVQQRTRILGPGQRLQRPMMRGQRCIRR